MKLVSKNPAPARETRMDKLRRERAGSLTMQTRFPAVLRLRIDLSFGGTYPDKPASQMLELHPAARAFFTYPCPYANCDGCFDLGVDVSAAIKAESRCSRGVLQCGGERTRGHAVRGPCELQLHYEIKPVYETRNSKS